MFHPGNDKSKEQGLSPFFPVNSYLSVCAHARLLAFPRGHFTPRIRYQCFFFILDRVLLIFTQYLNFLVQTF